MFDLFFVGFVLFLFIKRFKKVIKLLVYFSIIDEKRYIIDFYISYVKDYVNIF